MNVPFEDVVTRAENVVNTLGGRIPWHPRMAEDGAGAAVSGACHVTEGDARCLAFVTSASTVMGSGSDTSMFSLRGVVPPDPPLAKNARSPWERRGRRSDVGKSNITPERGTYQVIQRINTRWETPRAT